MEEKWCRGARKNPCKDNFFRTCVWVSFKGWIEEERERGDNFQIRAVIIFQVLIMSLVQDKHLISIISLSPCNPMRWRIACPIYRRWIFSLEMFIVCPRPYGRNSVWMCQITNTVLFQCHISKLFLINIILVSGLSRRILHRGKELHENLKGKRDYELQYIRPEWAPENCLDKLFILLRRNRKVVTGLVLGHVAS